MNRGRGRRRRRRRGWRRGRFRQFRHMRNFNVNNFRRNDNRPMIFRDDGMRIRDNNDGNAPPRIVRPVAIVNPNENERDRRRNQRNEYREFLMEERHQLRRGRNQNRLEDEQQQQHNREFVPHDVGRIPMSNEQLLETLQNSEMTDFNLNQLYSAIDSVPQIRNIQTSLRDFYFEKYRRMASLRVSEKIEEVIVQLSQPAFERHSEDNKRTPTVLEAILEAIEKSKSHRESGRSLQDHLAMLHSTTHNCKVPKSFKTICKILKSIGLEIEKHVHCTCGDGLRIEELDITTCWSCGKDLMLEENILEFYEIPTFCILRLQLYLSPDLYECIIQRNEVVEEEGEINIPERMRGDGQTPQMNGTHARRLIHHLHENNKYPYITLLWNVDGISTNKRERGKRKDFPEEVCGVFEVASLPIKKRYKYMNNILSTFSKMNKAIKSLDAILIPRLYEFIFLYENPIDVEVRRSFEEDPILMSLFIIALLFLLDKEAKYIFLKTIKWAGYFGCCNCVTRGSKDGREAMEFPARGELRSTLFYVYWGLWRYLGDDTMLNDAPVVAGHSVKALCALAIHRLPYALDWFQIFCEEGMHLWFCGGVMKRYWKRMQSVERIITDTRNDIASLDIRIWNSDYFQPDQTLKNFGGKAMLWRVTIKHVMYPVVFEILNNRNVLRNNNSLIITERLRDVIVELEKKVNRSLPRITNLCNQLFRLLGLYLKKMVTKAHNISEVPYFEEQWGLYYTDRMSFGMESFLSVVASFTKPGQRVDIYLYNMMLFQNILEYFRVFLENRNGDIQLRRSGVEVDLLRTDSTLLSTQIECLLLGKCLKDSRKRVLLSNDSAMISGFLRIVLQNEHINVLADEYYQQTELYRRIKIEDQHKFRCVQNATLSENYKYIIKPSMEDREYDLLEVDYFINLSVAGVFGIGWNHEFVMEKDDGNPIYRKELGRRLCFHLNDIIRPSKMIIEFGSPMGFVIPNEDRYGGLHVFPYLLISLTE